MALHVLVVKGMLWPRHLVDIESSDCLYHARGEKRVLLRWTCLYQNSLSIEAAFLQVVDDVQEKNTCKSEAFPKVLHLPLKHICNVYSFSQTVKDLFIPLVICANLDKSPLQCHINDGDSQLQKGLAAESKQNLDRIYVCVLSYVYIFFCGPLNAGFSSVCHSQELESKISSNSVEQEKDFYEEYERNGDQLNACEWFRELSYELLRVSLVQLVGWRSRHLAAAQMPILKPVRVPRLDFVSSGFIFLTNHWPVIGTLVK